MSDKLIARASIQIQKPVETVFDAIVNGDKMRNYFIAASTGNLEEGKTVQWKFPEFPQQFPVTAMAIRNNHYISFDWTGGIQDMSVEIFLESQPDGSTVVRISEKQKDKDDEGIQWLMQQAEGWANFLASLKAWMEYGINLRKGAFDFMAQPER